MSSRVSAFPLADLYRAVRTRIARAGDVCRDALARAGSSTMSFAQMQRGTTPPVLACLANPEFRPGDHAHAVVSREQPGPMDASVAVDVVRDIAGNLERFERRVVVGEPDGE